MLISEFLQVVIWAFIACLVVRAIFSWFDPTVRNPIHQVAYRIVEPVVSPIRRKIQPQGGFFDIAFLLVFFAATLLLQLVQQIRIG